MDNLGWWHYKHMAGGWTGLEITITNCHSFEEAYDFVSAWHAAQGREFTEKDSK